MPTPEVQAEPDNGYGAIRVCLDPDADDAIITAARVSEDVDLQTGGSAPASDFYRAFERDGNCYVHNRINLVCGGLDASSIYRPEFFQFNITATVGNTDYAASQPVQVRCDETSEITVFSSESDNEQGVTSARIRLSLDDCRTGQIRPAPRATRVELEPLDGQSTPGDPGYREVAGDGEFFFRDIEPGEYRVSAVWLDNPRDEGQSYEYTFDGDIRVNDGSSTTYHRELEGGPGGDRRCNPPNPDGDNTDETVPSCEESNPGISLSWFLCSVINFFDNTVQTLGNVVDDLLQINRAYYTDGDLRQAWAYFRNIASFLLIIIGLVMIIGQAITKG